MIPMIPPIPSEMPLAPGLSRGERRILGEEVRMLGVVEVTKPSSSGERASASGEKLETKKVRKTAISYRKSPHEYPVRLALLADSESSSHLGHDSRKRDNTSTRDQQIQRLQAKL